MFGRERILDAAYACLLEQAWRELPVEPRRFRLSCAVLSYQEYAELAGIPAVRLLANAALSEGCSVAGLRERDILLYNANSPVCRQRFTVAHELGHLLLCHSDRGLREEDEADFFASQLLMPDALLAALRRRGLLLTEGFLVRRFGVSRAAARLKRLSLTAPPLPHPLDDRLETLFYREIVRLSPVGEGPPPHDRYLDP